MDNEERKRVIAAIKARAAHRAQQKKLESFKRRFELDARLNAQKKLAELDANLAGRIKPGMGETIDNRPAEKLAKGKTKGMKKKSRSVGPGL